MPFFLVILAYGSAVALAFLLLYRFEPLHWALHVLCLIAALAIGLVKLPSELTTPEGTLAVGAVFFFLFTWGAFAPFFYRWHYHGHDRSAHHGA
ncbi:MAG: hypothetical protein U5J83_17315 [Bryobacterales bacterium]|nr:hypothetical protein [Bryobacterales bacterium]